MCEVDLISEYNSKFSSIGTKEIPTSKVCPNRKDKFKIRKFCSAKCWCSYVKKPSIDKNGVSFVRKSSLDL